MYKIEDLEGKIFFTSTACMSVWADALSWANAHTDLVVKDPAISDHIVVLSCQVTDLAILNNLRVAEEYIRKYPDKPCYISGCLAMRSDISIPENMKRLHLPKAYYQPLEDLSLIRYEPPFWVKDFDQDGNEFEDGHLFRNMYPLRIGQGCPFNCTYCTIRITRSPFEKYREYEELEKEFLRFDDVLLVADSPMPDQIKDWCEIATRNNKAISIRNIEPQIAVKCKDELIALAEKRLLKVFHCPIQSSNVEVLEDMGRNVADTFISMDIAKRLKDLGTFIATNIIIDYKGFLNDLEEIYKLYDYVSWNPLWDGKWDRSKAEERHKRYFEK